MESAQEILVIILASALAVFLLLAITLMIICIKIARHVRRISQKAEHIADKAENIADFMSGATTPLVIGKMITSITEMFGSKTSKRQRKD